MLEFFNKYIALNVEPLTEYYVKIKGIIFLSELVHL